MIICGSCMFEARFGKYMKKHIYDKGDGSEEGSGTCMSTNYCQRIEN
jgi:hypothetical protein